MRVCREAGIKRFINASTSSVYGVSDSPEVFEDNPKVPLTLYNRYKWECEEQLQGFNDPGFAWVTIRPATVCGYSPRCRLDLSVNILTNHAVNKGVITVFGGNQMRPNLHVEDMVDAYQLMLTAPRDKIHGEVFNIGFENHSIADLALVVKQVVEEEIPGRREVDIVTTPSDDNRSYHVNSDKIRRVLDFRAKRTIEDAVRDLSRAFRNHLLNDSFDDDWYYNVRTMKRIGAT